MLESSSAVVAAAKEERSERGPKEVVSFDFLATLALGEICPLLEVLDFLSMYWASDGVLGIKETQYSKRGLRLPCEPRCRRLSFCEEDHCRATRRIVEFQRFLIELSVLPGRSLAISDHLLPTSLCASIMIISSSGSHVSLLIDGFR